MKRIQIKKRKKMCVSCSVRCARFRYAGRVRWDHFHSLCPQCYRSFSDRLRAALAAAAVGIIPESENTFSVRPDPILVGLERGAYAVSNPLPPYAGAAELAATVGTALAISL